MSSAKPRRATKEGGGQRVLRPPCMLEPLFFSAQYGSKNPGFVLRPLYPYAIASLGVAYERSREVQATRAPADGVRTRTATRGRLQASEAAVGSRSSLNTTFSHSRDVQGAVVAGGFGSCPTKLRLPGAARARGPRPRVRSGMPDRR